MAGKRGPLFPIFDWQRCLLESPLPKETKTVGWALSTFTNKHGGSAHPGEALLAERLAPMTTRTVRTHLTRLRAEGFIVRVLRGSVAEHRRWADMYELAFPDETTGSGFPEVLRSVSGGWGEDDGDHRKLAGRPPETGSTDHRKPVSAQQRIASTNEYKASGSPDPAPLASARGGDFDPWADAMEIYNQIVSMFGGRLDPAEESAVNGMLSRGVHPNVIVNAIAKQRKAA